jgi:CheY-like chemotaxis protein
VREVVATILEEAGYRVLQASSGPAALETLAQTEGVRLLFTDVVMPGMNGFTLAEAAARLYPALKVTFMTGYTLQQPRPGMHVLQKPFRVQQVIRHVAVALAG